MKAAKVVNKFPINTSLHKGVVLVRAVSLYDFKCPKCFSIVRPPRLGLTRKQTLICSCGIQIEYDTSKSKKNQAILYLSRASNPTLNGRD